MLSISNLHVSVGDKPILKGLTLDVPAGEVHAIMGPNGAGKSTLGYALSGRPGYEATEGSVEWTGEDLLELDPAERGGQGRLPVVPVSDRDSRRPGPDLRAHGAERPEAGAGRGGGVGTGLPEDWSRRRRRR